MPLPYTLANMPLYHEAKIGGRVISMTTISYYNSPVGTHNCTVGMAKVIAVASFIVIL